MKRKSNKVVQKRERMRRAVIAFYQDNKKWPSSTAKDPKEMRMGMWISRTRYLKNHHPERLPEKIMDLIDWIDEEKIQMNLDQWENSYLKLKEFIDKNERWPALGSPDPAEAKLYNWCTTQRGLKKTQERPGDQKQDCQARCDRIQMGSKSGKTLERVVRTGKGILCPAPTMAGSHSKE
ncbi:MAG: hypothetical protein LUD46_21435 [Parabacteroides sp.]|nr:hypothetical protein [Parabacteroides sp.]